MPRQKSTRRMIIKYDEGKDELTYKKIMEMKDQAVKKLIQDQEEKEAVVTKGDVEIRDNNYYDVKVGDENRTYLVYLKDEMEFEGIKRMKESIHLYTPEFLYDVFKIKLPIKVIEAIKDADEANDACCALIDNWNEVVQCAVDSDGYASIFHSYDDVCHEVVYVENDKYYGTFYVMRID